MMDLQIDSMMMQVFSKILTRKFCLTYEAFCEDESALASSKLNHTSIILERLFRAPSGNDSAGCRSSQNSLGKHGMNS